MSNFFSRNDIKTQTDQHPSWEANSRSASQETLRLLWIRRFISVLKNPTYLEPDESSLHLFLLKSVLILLSHLRLGLPKWFLPFRFPDWNIRTFPISSMPTTRPSYLIFLDLNILIILDEAYKLRSSSLCSLLHSPVTSPFRSLSTLFTNTLNVLPLCTRPCLTPIQRHILTRELIEPCLSSMGPGILQGYELDDRRFESRQGPGIFLCTTASRAALESTQSPIQWVPGSLSPGVKRGVVLS
jgi:hypothetical protein